MTPSKLCAVVCTLLFLPSIVLSQTLIHHGPHEVYGVSDIIIAKDGRILLGTEGGLYESNDLGATWVRPEGVKNMIDQTPKFITNKKSSDIFWYGSSSKAEIYQTTDGGVSWKHRAFFQVPTITAAAVYGDSLIFGTEQGLFAKRLSDNSSSISISNTALKDIGIPFIAFEKNLIVAPTYSAGIYWSTNGGTTWKNGPMPGSSWPLNVSIADGNIFLSVFRGGMYVSTDQGTTWQAKNDGLDGSSVIDTYAEGDKLYGITPGKLYQTKPDATSPWTFIVNLPELWDPRAIAIKGNNIVLGSAFSVARSTNFGASWQTSLQGLSDVFTISSMHASSDGSIWATASGTGIYRRRVGESNFVEIFDRTRSDFAESKLRGDTLPIVTDGQIRMYNVITGSFGKSISISGLYPTDYLEVGDWQFLNTSNGVYRRGKDGKWTEFNNGFAPVANDLQNDGNTLYCGTFSGLFKANVELNEWTPITLGSGPSRVHRIVVDTNNIYVVREDGVYTSTDHGMTWKSLASLANSGVQTVYRVENALYAASQSSLFYSQDGAHTFAEQPVNVVVDAMVLMGDRLFLGTRENGIKSIGFNQNQTISFPIEETITNKEPFVLQARATSGLPVSYTSSDPTILSIINPGSQVTVLKPGTVTITASQSGNLFFKPAEDVQKTVTVNQLVVGIKENPAASVELYPNPGNGVYTIMLPLAISKDVKLTVTDIMGREIPTPYHVKDGTLEFRLASEGTAVFVALVRYNNQVIVKRFLNTELGN